MNSNRAILVLAITAIVTVTVLPCPAKSRRDQKKEDIWAEDEPGGPRPGPGRGPGPGPRMFKLTDEEIDRIMKDLKESDPAKAKELAELRKKDPDQFQIELREYGREQFGRIIRERMETWGRRRQTEFLQWFRKNYRAEAEELAKLKETEPDAWWRRFDSIREKYWPIFEEEKRNPELAAVLKEDLQLKKRRDELRGRIRAAKSEKEKQELTGQLEEVVGRRFDLIVRRKQIKYGWLLKWLEELQERIKESRAEIAKWQDEKFKAENVKQRVKELIKETPRFSWD
jgi:hypothetical protein